MIQIRPVSDLRNKFPEIETIVNSGEPVYLTKNGYGAMAVSYTHLDVYKRQLLQKHLLLHRCLRNR